MSSDSTYLLLIKKKDLQVDEKPLRMLPFIQVSVGGRIRGEPGAARAFCGIDYSLLSRCTSRVKSAPLSTTVTSSSSSTPSAGSSSSLVLVFLSPLSLSYLTPSHSIFLSLSLQRSFLSFATNFYLISTPPNSLSLPLSLPLSLSLSLSLTYSLFLHVASVPSL